MHSFYIFISFVLVNSEILFPNLWRLLQLLFDIFRYLMYNITLRIFAIFSIKSNQIIIIVVSRNSIDWKKKTLLYEGYMEISSLFVIILRTKSVVFISIDKYIKIHVIKHCASKNNSIMYVYFTMSIKFIYLWFSEVHTIYRIFFHMRYCYNLQPE